MHSQNPQQTLREILQHARKHKNLSQLELSMRIGVSQRHISFIESARARPSRSLLVDWLLALDVPPKTRDRALLLAGFAPGSSDTQADQHPDALEPARGALRQLLMAHEPLPAYVIDAHWNLVDLNQGGRWLASLLMPGIADTVEPNNINLLELMMAPDGILTKSKNLSEVGPALLAHVRDDANAVPALQPRAAALAEFLRSRAVEEVSSAPWFQRSAPSLVSRFETPLGELAFLSVFTTFGTPQDIDRESLRVEYMFPANPETQRVLGQLAGSAVKHSAEVTAAPDQAEESKRLPLSRMRALRARTE